MISEEDKKKLIAIGRRFHKKYSQFAELEAEHERTCGVWRYRKCNCKPNFKVRERHTR